MAAKRKKRKTTRSRRRKKTGGGFMQRVLVGFAGVALVLCVASITHGFIFRGSSERGVDGRFQVEVWNGTGKSGLAHSVKRSLLRRGVDVIDVGNAPTFDYQETVLIARRPGADVEALGRILGCPNVVEQLVDDYIADATLILGDDFRDLNLDWLLESDLLE